MQKTEERVVVVVVLVVVVVVLVMVGCAVLGFGCCLQVPFTGLSHFFR